MEKDWNEILRQKMEGHQKNPPEGLWEGIAEQMDVVSTPVRKTPVRRLWYGAAAAVVLALTGFFVFYHPQTDEQPIVSGTITQPKNTPATDDSTAPVEKKPVLAQGGGVSPYNINTAPVRMYVNTQDVQPTSDENVSSKETEDMKEVEARKDEIVVTDQNDQVKEKQSPSTEEHLRTESLPRYNTTAVSNRPQTQKKKDAHSNGQWSVGVRASGGLLAYSSSEHSEPVYYDTPMSNANTGNPSGGGSRPGYSGIRPYRITERVADHHLPIRVGASLLYHLNEKTALLTGINYTYLYSKFSVPLYETSGGYEQKLRYLGVPLGLSQQLWKINQLRIYASGSVMLEKCLNDKPWQWSVNGAVGAEYGLGQYAGIYFEPSVGYYFKDGTDLEHYYSEHPFAPAIEFGIRLHLNDNNKNSR